MKRAKQNGMLSRLLYRLYRINRHRVRRYIRSLVTRLEGGEFYSTTLRRIFEHYHQVKIGLYTQGGCFIPFHVDKHTTIGRYCSIARSVRIMNRNHPLNFKSTHAFFFNPRCGICSEDPIAHIPLTVGNDVWIGHGALVMPNVREIGTGAVIAAGAVVNKDVPPYAVVVGNPGRVVRFRFDKEIIDDLLQSCWWEKSIDELLPELPFFQKQYGEEKPGENSGACG